MTFIAVLLALVNCSKGRPMCSSVTRKLKVIMVHCSLSCIYLQCSSPISALRKDVEFSWLQRFSHCSVLFFSFSKEEERSPEGRGVSSRSTENLPCWGLGTAGHTHEEAAGWVSEATWADRKVSSNRQSQNNPDRIKWCLGLFFWHISNFYLTAETARHSESELRQLFDTIECILGVVLLCWFFVGLCAFTRHRLYTSASFANSHVTFKYS